MVAAALCTGTIMPPPLSPLLRACPRSRSTSTANVPARLFQYLMTLFVLLQEFNVVAREWRCKWSEDDGKKSLVELQKILAANLATLKALPGAKVQRVVCGGCHDFKIITSLAKDDFGPWEAAGFAPEADVLAAMGAVAGASQVETQTFTLMEQ